MIKKYKCAVCQNLLKGYHSLLKHFKKIHSQYELRNYKRKADEGFMFKEGSHAAMGNKKIKADFLVDVLHLVPTKLEITHDTITYNFFDLASKSTMATFKGLGLLNEKITCTITGHTDKKMVTIAAMSAVNTPRPTLHAPENRPMLRVLPVMPQCKFTLPKSLSNLRLSISLSFSDTKHDFDSMQTKSRQVATESKDTVFSPFFDIDQITSLCAGYSLTFAHNVLVLPGLKTVRVNGYLKNPTSVDSSTSFQERRVKRKREFIEHEPSSNTAVLQANIDAFKR